MTKPAPPAADTADEPLIPTTAEAFSWRDQLAEADAYTQRLTGQLNGARRAAQRLLVQERQHCGHGRDGHLNEDDLAPLLTALQIAPAGPATADPASTDEAPTWDDVYAAIGREVWKLAPQEFQDAGHRDLVFGTCWQNIMEAVQNGILAVAALPDEDQP